MLTLRSRLQPFTSPRTWRAPTVRSTPNLPQMPHMSDMRAADTEMEAINQMSAHAQESVELLRQIAIKAPQLAAVLDQLEEGGALHGGALHGGALRRIEFSEAPVQLQMQPAPLHREAASGSILDMTAGLLSNAFPSAAPLFYSCRAYLHLKLLKNRPTH